MYYFGLVIIFSMFVVVVTVCEKFWGLFGALISGALMLGLITLYYFTCGQD